MQVISRNEIGLRAAKSATKFLYKPKGTVAHWEGINLNASGDLEDAKKVWRNIQSSHMANKSEGYVDIAYNYGISLGGHILEGRGDTIQGGANGTSQANKDYLSVVFIMGVNQTLTEAAKSAYLQLYSRIGGERKLHKDFRATACPGDQITSWIRSGCPMSGANPTPAPELPKPVAPGYPLPVDHWYGVKSSNPRNHSGYWEQDRPAIRLIQASLGTIADGVYGNITRQKVINFQQSNGLTPDGLAGANTWRKIFY